MLSNQQVQLINSLQQRKFRQKYNLFKVEGVRSVNELLASDLTTELLVITEETLPHIVHKASIEPILISQAKFERISSHKSPQGALALAEIPRIDLSEIKIKKFIIALDGIQDPGNLGTIVRIADWYGLTDIICSPSCADIFNPKTLQSSMGSAFHLRVHYTDLKKFLSQNPLPVYGALLNGTDVRSLSQIERGILLIGNEGNGISAEILPFITHPLTIPRLGKAESLNAAVATGILMDNLSRLFRAV